MTLYATSSTTQTDGTVLEDIRQRRIADNTYPSGGEPHTFSELFGGNVVETLRTQPDVRSYRSNYYYNSTENNLYKKKAEWTQIETQIDSEDESFVYRNGVRISKLVDEPDPNNFGDIYYYSLRENIIYGKILRWVRSNSL
jgi:hypothetical protein